MSKKRFETYMGYLTDRNIVFTILIASIMLLIFVTDLQYTTELYVGVLYIIVVMLSLWLPRTQYTLYFAISCTLLTMFGYFFSIYNISPTQYFHVENFINLSLTLAVIWITTVIAMYIKGMALALRKSETIHKVILDTSIDPILIINTNGQIENSSRTITKMFGWNPQEIKGKNFSSLLSNQFRDKYTKFLLNYGNNPDNLNLIGLTEEAVACHRMQREFPCEVSINYINIPEINEVFFTAVLRDISMRKVYEKKLGWLSTHDELTKIYNRRFFNEQIEKEWFRLLRSQESLAIILIDVDFFKNYNDTLGHQTGDNCLSMIAECLQSCSRRASDIVARYGGEEFIILLPGTDVDGAEQVANNIKGKIAALNIPHPASSVSKKITLSMGLAAMVPLMGCSFERLVHFADQALYQAKQEGRNRFCVYKE